MPFIQRKVTPVNLSNSNNVKLSNVLTSDNSELLAVNNYTLSNAIRQIASLAVHAEDIFQELKHRLTEVNNRSTCLKERLTRLECATENLDARIVAVPESDLSTEFRKQNHFVSKNKFVTNLFDRSTRPRALAKLYDSIATSQDITTSICLPNATSSRKHQIKLDDIETGKPAALQNLRAWKSSEVLGDTVAPPDCSAAPPIAISTEEHQLPSPEEQWSAVARRFPGQLVAVNVSGNNFDRQQSNRRSMSHVMEQRHRKKRSKRRNTIACSTDVDLIRQAADGESEGGSAEEMKQDSERALGHRVLWHLKQWGLHRLSRTKPRNKNDETEKRSRSTSPPHTTVRMRANTERKKEERHSSSGNWSGTSSSARTSVESHAPPSSSTSSIGNDSALSSTRVKATEIIAFDDSSCNNDGENSSVYSCDTEGYYTSFHMDSGLKRPIEDPIIECETVITKAVENEYELFGKGSTSTTTSSAGTVCTTLLVPRTPSPEQDVLKRRMRIQDALTSVRIPSMCVVTPPPSDDEFNKQQIRYNTVPRSEKTNKVLGSSFDALHIKTEEDSNLLYEELEASLIRQLEASVYDEGEYVIISESNTLKDAEYISLNELPEQNVANSFSEKQPVSSLERKGARVTLDSEGRVVYSSDSLKRKPKTSNTTFEPGQYVKSVHNGSDMKRTKRTERLTVKAASGPSRPMANLGAYVDMKEYENEDKSQEHNKIKRNESYRLAAKSSPVLNEKRQPLKPVPERTAHVIAERTNKIINPNVFGSRFYGAKIMIDEKKISPIRKVKTEQHYLQATPQTSRVTIPSDTQKARILNTGNDTEIW